MLFHIAILTKLLTLSCLCVPSLVPTTSPLIQSNPPLINPGKISLLQKIYDQIPILLPQMFNIAYNLLLDLFDCICQYVSNYSWLTDLPLFNIL